MIVPISFSAPRNPEHPQSCRYTELTLNGPEHLAGFPLIAIDSNSYIVRVEIQSGLDFDVNGGRHCVAIGKGCSMADAITFMIDLDHDYTSVFQGAVSGLEISKANTRTRRKGTIILQNDVWVGHGATIMNGVILRNGCVVAANSVVTKDVPPYAIVGGNPARVLKYRFDPETIDGMQKIAWWDWPDKLMRERREDFFLPPEEFVTKYLPLADNPPPPRTFCGRHVRRGGKLFSSSRMWKAAGLSIPVFCRSISVLTALMWNCFCICQRSFPGPSI